MAFRARRAILRQIDDLHLPQEQTRRLREFAQQQVGKVIGLIEQLRSALGLPTKTPPPPAEKNPLIEVFHERFSSEFRIRKMTSGKANPSLVPSLVAETIRYQTPVIHMRRTAARDTELAGRRIRKGDKVVMWYVSGNRDESAIENPDAFTVDRAKPRQHLSYGAGIHRCVGDRLADLQLRILWEEILARGLDIEVMGPPRRLYSNFIRGIRELPVRIKAH